MPRDSAALALQLCRELSGVEETSERFAASAMKRATARFGSAPIQNMLAAYKEGGVPAVMAAEGGVARAILYCLYTGLLPDEKGEKVMSDGPTSLTTEDHFESLMWRVIQAHPPALSGGYFGHWHYPPEDA